MTLTCLTTCSTGASRAASFAAVLLTALLLVPACGDESGGGGGEGGGGEGGGGGGGGQVERGGPHSLLGFSWTSEPFTSGGIEFVFSFEFDADSLTFANTCDGSLTASLDAPVRYRYKGNIPSGDTHEVESDGATCFVEVLAGTFDFEIVNNRLVVVYQGETVEFEPVGSVAGLYGDWRASVPEIGSITWSMGGGEITATADCANGLSATIAVDADFENLLEFPEGGENVVSDGFGFECSVSLEPSLVSYRFDGDTLIMEMDGEELRLEPRS